MATSREERIAKNEAVFREVNERIKEMAEPFAEISDRPVGFVCECGQAGCHEPIELTVDEYERVRSHHAHFVVAPGHDDPTVEKVIRRADGYDVVEKHPEEARIALESDPRASP